MHFNFTIHVFKSNVTLGKILYKSQRQQNMSTNVVILHQMNILTYLSIYLYTYKTLITLIVCLYG